jgi:hypothetical protein
MVYVDREDMVTACDPERFVDERPGPDTVQLDTSDELHVIVEEPPGCTRIGLASIDTCGWSTVTVAIFEFTTGGPPRPMHAI